MNDFYNVMYMIIHAFDIVIMYKLFGVFLGSKPKSKAFAALSYLLYYLATGLIYIFVDIAWITLCVNIITLLIITLNYKSSLNKKILCVTFSYIIIFAGEILICAATGYYEIDIFDKGSYNSVFGQAMIKVTTYVIALIISYFKDLKKDMPISISSWLVTFFVPIATMYMEFNFITSGTVDKLQACLSIIIVLMLNFICIYMYNSLSSMYQIRMNEVLLKQEKSYYLNQCELMKESTEQLRAFRHDMKNQLFVIKEMCDKNLCGEASVQLGKYAEGLEIKTYYSNSGNMVIDSLINYKLKNADVDGINVETEISVPSKINIEVRDLVTILGNLLDNSLTALESVSENKNLYIKVVYDRGRVIISVKNTYAIPVKYVNGEIVSTKEDSENHGYGLKNIKKTVEKYDGYIEDDHANNTFSVDIILFVKPELDNE